MSLEKKLSVLEEKVGSFLKEQEKYLGKSSNKYFKDKNLKHLRYSESSFIFLKNKGYIPVYNYVIENEEDNKDLGMYFNVKKKDIKKILIWPKGAGVHTEIEHSGNPVRISFKKGKLNIKREVHHNYRPSIIMEKKFLSNKIIIGYDNQKKRNYIKEYKAKKFSIKKLKKLITKNSIKQIPPPPFTDEHVPGTKTCYQSITGWEEFLKDISSLDENIKKMTDKKKTKDKEEKYVLCGMCDSKIKRKNSSFCPYCGNGL